jgi:hypothetical protein
MPFEMMERIFGLLGLCLLVFAVTVWKIGSDWNQLTTLRPGSHRRWRSPPNPRPRRCSSSTPLLRRRRFEPPRRGRGPLACLTGDVTAFPSSDSAGWARSFSYCR